ncbi:hypothetical protein [Hymenobacter volaticus]|uniref:Uncharacterized protein n=1 Tax=Hymenobacter volaticus TaxID=2932254 RepID=A0ABY4G503_9BACT|nr:hypothetical protein [Hymenobacter volaticus]UOQ65970.1 hypothetical protein MUN86_21050 [Hymenobacter volaticus]
MFRVSGTIHLLGDLRLNRANTTIAGQTAPATVFALPIIRSASMPTTLLSASCASG